MSRAHSRQTPEARIASTVAVTNVAAATDGPAASGAPSGTSFSLSTAMDMTVTAISMSAVPETTGVMILRSIGSHAASAN